MHHLGQTLEHVGSVLRDLFESARKTFGHAHTYHLNHEENCEELNLSLPIDR